MAQATITLVLDDGQAIKGLLKVGNQGEKTSKEVESNFTKSFSRIGKSIVAAAAAYASFRTGVAFIKESIQAASKQEDAINSLNAALIGQGKYSKEASDSLVEFAGSLQKVTTVGDEVTIQGAALISTMSGLSGDALKRATKASLDFAAALNIDTRTAFDLVGKSATGYVSALSRYGLRVKTTGDATKDFNAVLDLLEEKFSGQAASKVNTYSGAIAQLSNIYGDLTETVGQAITNSPVIIELIKEISKQFLIASDYIKKFNEQGDFIGSIVKDLIDIALVLNTVVVGGFEAVINVIQAAGNYWGAFVASIVQAASGDFSQAFDTIKSGLSDSFEKLTNFDTTKTTEQFLIKLQEVANAAEPKARELGNNIASQTSEGVSEGITFDAFAEEFGKTANKMQVTAQSLAKSMNQTIGAGVANAFVAFGAALAKGENALEAFGKVVLGVFADILIQLGTQTLAVGIGMSAVPILFGFEGPAAIAAGIGMLVAGGALKALAGGGGGGGGVAAAPATGAGGVAASTAAGVSPLTGQPDVQEQGTNVQVVVQGNILNNKESALYIAEVLNESFRSNGTVVATG